MFGWAPSLLPDDGWQYEANPIGTSTTRPQQSVGPAGPIDPVVGSGRLPVTRDQLREMARAAWQTAGAVSDGGMTAPGMMGAIKAAGRGGFSLEQVHPRTLRPVSTGLDPTQPGAHAFSIKDSAGNKVGIVDTRWNPETGNLHIEDIQSNEGANTLGLSAIREVRDMLLGRYPGTSTLTGHRITGAGAGRDAVQAVESGAKGEQSSRPAASAPSDSALVDPALIEILRKYAVPAAVTGTAAVPFGWGPQQ